ncbi:MAG: ANTAR domain-containing protein [Ruminococcus sp.]|nr:ANTAR domain-containing protein [Ruminococcus sp.]
MELKEINYTVLIVSSSAKMAQKLTMLLDEQLCFAADSRSSAAAARRVLAERQYDMVIITDPLPDESASALAVELCGDDHTVVALITDVQNYGDVSEHVCRYGAFVLPKPAPKQLLLQALDWMQSTRERLRRFEKKQLSLQDKMKEIRAVNRAKWLLISSRGMSEEEAHRYIEKEAMDCGVSKLLIALQIISEEE